MVREVRWCGDDKLYSRGMDFRETTAVGGDYRKKRSKIINAAKQKKARSKNNVNGKAQ